MKKIIVFILMGYFLFINSVSYAHFDKRFDSFDESIMFYSYNLITPMDDLRFRKKVLVDGTSKYSVLLSTNVENENYMYSKKDTQIKIDGSISCIKILDTNYMHYNFSDDVVNSEAELLPEHIEKLKVAQEVSLRFYYVNGLVNTMDIPNEVLAEWKEVINMDK